MYIKKRKLKNGSLRDRSFDRMAFEAFMCYLMSLIRLPPKRRAIYCKYLAARGFDVSVDEMRPNPAPKPPCLNDAAGLDSWIRQNLEAKGWDSSQGRRPLLVKSDLVTHGGRERRQINGYTVLLLSVEFLASRLVHGGVCLVALSSTVHLLTILPPRSPCHLVLLAA